MSESESLFSLLAFYTMGGYIFLFLTVILGVILDFDFFSIEVPMIKYGSFPGIIYLLLAGLHMNWKAYDSLSKDSNLRQEAEK